MVAYLPVQAELRNYEGSSIAVSIYIHVRCTQSDTMKALHECIEHCLDPL